MFKKLLQYYQIFCNLSLDVVIGVICCMLPLPLVFHVTLPCNWYITLPLGTWLIYLADHVVDVTRKKQDYPSPRHQYIKQHLKLIIGLLISISVVIAWQVLHPFSTLLFTVGCILASLVVLHLLIVRINPTRQSWYNNKELAIAILYSSGIYAAPVVMKYQHHENVLIPCCCMLLLALIAFLNLLMVSIIERSWDEEMDNASLVRVLGFRQSVRLFYVLMAIGLSAILLLLMIAPLGYATMLLCYTVIILGHWIIYGQRTSLLPYLVYRKVSEALFWLPAIAFFLCA